MPLNPQERLAMAAMIVDRQPEEIRTFIIALEHKNGAIEVFTPCGHRECCVTILTNCVGHLLTDPDVIVIPMENRNADNHDEM
jgi:hypothetical protein